MKTKPPKPLFERILAFISLFELPGYKYGTWHDKVIHFCYSSDVTNFITTLYEDSWIYDFNWGKWHSEALAFYRDSSKLASASVEQLQKLLTFHVRKDRFVEGHLAAMLEEGHILAILRRIAEIYNQDSKENQTKIPRKNLELS